METEKKPWFKPKSFGWGWQPNTWEGWVLSVLYAIGLIRSVSKAISTDSASEFLISFGLDFIILTGFFLIICYMTSKFPLVSATPAAPAQTAVTPGPKPEDNKAPQAEQ